MWLDIFDDHYAALHLKYNTYIITYRRNIIARVTRKRSTSTNRSLHRYVNIKAMRVDILTTRKNHYSYQASLSQFFHVGEQIVFH